MNTYAGARSKTLPARRRVTEHCEVASDGARDGVRKSVHRNQGFSSGDSWHDDRATGVHWHGGPIWHGDHIWQGHIFYLAAARKMSHDSPGAPAALQGTRERERGPVNGPRIRGFFPPDGNASWPGLCTGSDGTAVPLSPCLSPSSKLKAVRDPPLSFFSYPAVNSGWRLSFFVQGKVRNRKSPSEKG